MGAKTCVRSLPKTFFQAASWQDSNFTDLTMRSSVFYELVAKPLLSVAQPWNASTHKIDWSSKFVALNLRRCRRKQFLFILLQGSHWNQWSIHLSVCLSGFEKDESGASDFLFQWPKLAICKQKEKCNYRFLFCWLLWRSMISCHLSPGARKWPKDRK